MDKSRESGKSPKLLIVNTKKARSWETKGTVENWISGNQEVGIQMLGYQADQGKSEILRQRLRMTNYPEILSRICFLVFGAFRWRISTVIFGILTAVGGRSNLRRTC